MTSLFMSLSVNDYLVISAWMIMIALILFAFCFYAIVENPIISGLSFISALFLSYGLLTFDIEKIPEYGTEAQKAKMAYCVKQYTQSNNVGLEAVTHDNLESIMKQCREQDAKNKPIEEQNLKIKNCKILFVKSITSTNKG